MEALNSIRDKIISCIEDMLDYNENEYTLDTNINLLFSDTEDIDLVSMLQSSLNKNLTAIGISKGTVNVSYREDNLIPDYSILTVIRNPITFEITTFNISLNQNINNYLDLITLDEIILNMYREYNNLGD